MLVNLFAICQLVDTDAEVDAEVDTEVDVLCSCLAIMWLEAYEAGVAPLVKPEATHEKVLEFMSRAVYRGARLWVYKYLVLVLRLTVFLMLSRVSERDCQGYVRVSCDFRVHAWLYVG
mmetsp:Transcript_23698/g.28592  ORF Transcript_23698/g.28592 Transcript_23698/m.28592 type:complete len:118 (+) Transcript_23698:67-420(+)